jgi:NitT/TauT family transport system substrate-binding protein
MARSNTGDKGEVKMNSEKCKLQIGRRQLTGVSHVDFFIFHFSFFTQLRFRQIAIPLLMFAVVGCQQQPSPPVKTPSLSSTTSEATSSVEVVLALNWFPEAEHGGYYAALTHGYFAEEGLSVTIRPGSKKVQVVTDVADGSVAFGVDNADKLLSFRAQEADVVAVMSPIQNSPRCIMVHKKLGLTRLEDLAGRKPFTLAMNGAQPFAQFLKKRVDLTDIQIVAYPANVVQFLIEPNYGQQAYSFSEPFLAEQKESDPQCLMLSDLGFNTYTSMLLARRELIETQPELVAKMTRASIRGWKKYLAEPAETNRHIHEQNPEMPLDVLEFGVKALKPLCLPEGFSEDRLGEMTAERWKTLVDQLVEIEVLKPGAVSADDAFTTKFF